ncbi:hypothetical protein KP509_24G034800 [Ceratopteris richardii]|nr:hypothetical protein KP509_24G034800 [Ceratopteris richardii]
MYRKSRRKYGSCFLWLRRCAQFACSVCKASYSCANHIGSGKPWWTSTRLTVFGLREDGRTWEKCVVANEHLEEVYKPPPWWKRLLLKLRAGTRRADCLNPCSHWQSHQNAFCYDPVSYALNFDDSAACMQHHHHEVCCPHGAPISGALDSDEE